MKLLGHNSFCMRVWKYEMHKKIITKALAFSSLSLIIVFKYLLILCGKLSLCSFWHRLRFFIDPRRENNWIVTQKVCKEVFSSHHWPNLLTNSCPLAVHRLTQDGGSWLWKLRRVEVGKLWFSIQKDLQCSGKVLTLVHGQKMFAWLPSSSQREILNLYLLRQLEGNFL